MNELQPNDREGLSPSPEGPAPRDFRIADLLEDDDDDIEFEPSTDQSETNEGTEEEEEEEEEEEDGDEYVGGTFGIQNMSRIEADQK
jgi:hypothetical protein